MHFTGKERDAESGNDNFKARYYGSSMARFLTPDPSGIRLSNITDPQQLNLYAYVRNNPLKLVDPTGLDPLDCTDEPGDCGFDSPINPFAQSPAEQFGPGAPNGGGLLFNNLAEAADNFNPFVYTFTDSNGATYPGTFSSWDEYASWSTGIAALVQWQDDIAGQYQKVSAGLLNDIGPGAKANPNDPRIVGMHANFALTCDSTANCQVGRYDYGIHIECASGGYNCGPGSQLVVHGDTVSPWISPFTFSNFNLGNFLEHGFVDLIGGTLGSPFGFVFPN